MTSKEKKDLINYLKSFVTDNRLARFDQVLSQRMNHMQIVLENIYQPHNASAVLRSADCFGVQYIHAIEKRNKYIVNEDVAMGSGNWVTLNKFREEDSGEGTATKKCLSTLKENGFTIVATTPHEKEVTLDQLPVDKKFALVFGTEQEGISQDVFSNADAFVKIPMYGFTESFNISVCAALCMYELTKRIRSSSEIKWQLTEEEKTDVYLAWLRNTISKVELIEKEYFSKK
jgi:tRNA (guanosine-2'-O-)-methyltransferase